MNRKSGLIALVGISIVVSLVQKWPPFLCAAPDFSWTAYTLRGTSYHCKLPGKWVSGSKPGQPISPEDQPDGWTLQESTGDGYSSFIIPLHNAMLIFEYMRKSYRWFDVTDSEMKGRPIYPGLKMSIKSGRWQGLTTFTIFYQGSGSDVTEYKYGIQDKDKKGFLVLTLRSRRDVFSGQLPYFNSLQKSIRLTTQGNRNIRAR